MKVFDLIKEIATMCDRNKFQYEATIKDDDGEFWLFVKIIADHDGKQWGKGAKYQEEVVAQIYPQSEARKFEKSFTEAFIIYDIEKEGGESAVEKYLEEENEKIKRGER